MPHPVAKQNQSGRESLVARLQCEAGGSAGCMALVVAHQRASGMGTTGTAPVRRKRLRFESSLNRFANKRRFRGDKADIAIRNAKCPLMTQSGHYPISIPYRCSPICYAWLASSLSLRVGWSHAPERFHQSYCWISRLAADSGRAASRAHATHWSATAPYP
jgi:hypothetical protein